MNQANIKPAQKWNKTLTNLVVDLVFLLAFLIVIEERATGIVVHEWLGVAILAVILTHVLLHWSWVVAVSKRFLGRLKTEPRLNVVVDALIFTGFVTVIFSGLMISESVLPALGLRGVESPFWRILHVQATDATLVLAALHLGLHWKWFVDLFRGYIAMPLKKLPGKMPAQNGEPQPVVQKIH